MTKELTWRKAIEKVLSEAPGAMHYKDLTEKIIQDGLKTTLGATPTAIVYTQLLWSIKNEGDKSPFQKVGRGLFVWKANAGITQTATSTVEEAAEEEVQYEVIYVGAHLTAHWEGAFTSIQPTGFRQDGIGFRGSGYFQFLKRAIWAVCLNLIDGVAEILNLQPRAGKAKVYQVKQVRAVITSYGLVGQPETEEASGDEASPRATEENNDG